MVILIGGDSCVGKTLLAKRFVQKYSFSCLSLDHLKMGLIRSGAECGFTAESPDLVISAKLWRIVAGIIMTAVENGQNLILEGCYLPPDKIAALGDEYLAHIVSFHIAFSYAYSHEHYGDIIAHREDIERRKYPETRTADDIADDNEHTIIQCANCASPCCVIEKDYVSELSAFLAPIEAEIDARLSSGQ